MNAGFIREGSVTLTANGQILNENVDYTVDYWGSKITLKSDRALDPTAIIDVSYETNDIISFDKKIVLGSFLKYNITERNFLSGGAYYYQKSVLEDKVDLGYEPMENFIWNVSGNFEQEVPLLTDWIDKIPLLETNSPSKFHVEGEYAEVYPNPNPLGEAFLDDFESSKRTTSTGILMRQWRKSSIPVYVQDNIGMSRGKIAWYNPYIDVNTKSIWPNISKKKEPMKDHKKFEKIKDKHDK